MTETRALTAALSGPVFDGAASRSALHTSERHAERWAPEGDSARRASGMRSLAFADRVASPWMQASSGPRMSHLFGAYAGTASERSAPHVSWLFPRPWFQDELDWMAAARQGLEATPRRGAMTTRGTFVTPTGESGWAGIAMPVLSADAMAAVAPSMSGGDPAVGLRAWSPMVDFATASAAEVMAGAMQSVTSAGLPGIAERSPIWSGLSMVTPRGLASGEAFSPSAAAAARSSFMAPAMGVAPTAVEAARQSIARIESRVDDLRAPVADGSPAGAPATFTATAASADAPRADASSPASSSSESFASTDASSQSTGASSLSTSASSLSTSEERLAGAAHSSPAASSALRTVELLLGALAARQDQRATSSAAAATTAPSVGAPSVASADGVSSSTESSASPGAAAATFASSANFAPIAGPRVAMPAGLGGLVQSLAAVQSVARPMAQVRDGGADAALASPRDPAHGFVPGASSPGATGATAMTPPSFTPVWASPSVGALASVAASPARAIDHLSWSDRWLARFSGASPLAMSAFESATEFGAPTLRQLAVGSPEVVYVHPQLASSSIAATVQRAQVAHATQFAPLADRAPSMAPVAPSTRPDGRPAPLRIDDGEAVPDAIFAAIAAAGATPTRRDVATPAGARAAEVRAAEVRAAEARAAELGTTAAAAQAAASFASPSVSAPVDMLLSAGRRASVADLVAVSAPSAPDAGLAPGLASSPMAPALAAVLPLPSAPIFDPRALQGGGLAGAYLGGLVARSAAPVGVLATAPSLAALSRAGAEAPTSAAMSSWTLRDLALAPQALRLAGAAPSTPFVTSLEPRGRARHEVAAQAAIAGSPARAAAPLDPPLSPAPLGSATLDPATLAALPADVVAAIAAGASPAAALAAFTAASAPGTSSAEVAASAGSASSPRVLEAELVALRSAMLAAPTSSSVPLASAAHAPLISGSVAVPAHGPSQLATLGGVATGIPAPFATAQARSSAATFADGAPYTYAAGAAAGAAPHGASIASAGGRPGSLAEAALAWSVNEERTAANLAFDFVTPELILAAKVYGLSAGAAAEAMRLASAGPTSMAAMATHLDLTLLRAFQAAPAATRAGAAGTARAQRSVGQEPGAPAPGTPGPFVTGAAPSPATSPELQSAAAMTPDVAAVASPTAVAQGTAAERAAADRAAALDPWTAAMAPFGAAMPAGPSRLPRGAFLWPPGAIAALGLRALSPDGAAGLPVVALELLAAQAVAELGTWVTAFPGAARGADRDDDAALPMAGGRAGAMTNVLQGPLGAASFVTQAGSPVGVPTGDAGRVDPARVADDAVEASAAMAVPASIRQRFESVYIALARSAEGQSLSPAARAARAMSLFAGSSAGLSTREAAAATWSMLPDVYRGDLDLVSPVAGRDAGSDVFAADARPGLAGLAARAGEALGSFVSPSMAEVRAVGRHGDAPAAPESAAAARGAAAAPVYVDTAAAPAARPAPGFAGVRPGRTFTQYGGGEPEIPGWFESAAQKMFSSGGDDRGGMSLAQMVLVTAMPQQQVAAATRGASSSGGSAAPGGAGGKQGAVDKPDVDKLALEVFHEVMHLLDIARQRSGDSQ
ncbi:MAG: hypothetical protein IPL61_01815 [Myxococcales bacterium]|nr:hypothetical protein [Myxococcales bacterium]